MNKIDKDEVFRHLSDFWKSKGIELQEGSCTQGIKKGCELLAETVNLSQQALERARTEMEKHLEQMRQVIHEQTAPRTPPPQTRPEPSFAKAKGGETARQGNKSGKAKAKMSKRRGAK